MGDAVTFFSRLRASQGRQSKAMQKRVKNVNGFYSSTFFFLVYISKAMSAYIHILLDVPTPGERRPRETKATSASKAAAIHVDLPCTC
jgi:hypothetical protein